MADTTLRHRGYLGSIETSIDDRCFHGRVLFINDLVCYGGESFDELEKEFIDSVDRYLAHCEEIGKSPNRPCSGVFQVRISPDLHRLAAMVATKESISLNDLMARALRSYMDKPSAIDINHHHDHAVKITVQAADSTALRALAAESGKPTEWTVLPASSVH